MSEQQRTEKGFFSNKVCGEKKIRSMRLTDEAWQQLELMAQSENLTRTDVIENFARGKTNHQQIILKAIERFIETKRKDWGRNKSQKGEFNRNSRTWDIFNQFIDTTEFDSGDK